MFTPSPRIRGNHAKIVDAMHIRSRRRSNWADRSDDPHTREQARKLAAEEFLRTWRANVQRIDAAVEVAGFDGYVADTSTPISPAALRQMDS